MIIYRLLSGTLGPRHHRIEGNVYPDFLVLKQVLPIGSVGGHDPAAGQQVHISSGGPPNRWHYRNATGLVLVDLVITSIGALYLDV